jgi:hypothetical protein
MRAFAFISLLLFSTLPVGAQATGSKFSNQQWFTLVQEVCSAPAYQAKQYDADTWFCDKPRDYPMDASYKDCQLTFLAADENGLAHVYYGQFTTLEPQAIVMYGASCESHAANFGGMALFRVVDDGFRLIRYYPGQLYVDCAVPPVGGTEFQTLYCFSSHSGQGELEEIFGPLTFAADGQLHFEAWLSAGNWDGDAPSIDCEKPKPNIHHLTDVSLDSAKVQIVVTAASLDRRSVANACSRYRRHEFSDEEEELRDISIADRERAFVRPHERKYVKLIIYFQPPSNRPKIEITSKSVPGD